MESETVTPTKSTKNRDSVKFITTDAISPPRDGQDIEASEPQTTGPPEWLGFRLSDEDMKDLPFIAGIKKYLEQCCALHAESTRTHKARILRYIGCQLEDMKRQKKIKTTDPARMDKEDVIAFIRWLQEYRGPQGKPLDSSTQAKWLHYMDGMLAVHDNSTLQKLKVTYRSVLPREKKKPIQTKTIAEIRRLIAATDSIRGWWGVVAKFAIIIYATNGMRVSELRKAYVEDLRVGDVMNFYVRFPKGFVQYGIDRTIAINPNCRPHIAEFLQERQAYLAYIGVQSHHLIPFVSAKGVVSDWPLEMWQKLSGLIRQRSGVNFNWRILRPSFASHAVNDYGISIQDVSEHLGHGNIATTQKYYAQINSGLVRERILAAYQHSEDKLLLPSVEPNKI